MSHDAPPEPHSMTETCGRYAVDRPAPPEAICWAIEPVRHAAACEVRVRHEAIGAGPVVLLP